MATKNKPIMVYLPKDVEDSLISFCNEHNKTRIGKDGQAFPSLGTGILDILKSFFSNSNNQENTSIIPSKIPYDKSELPDNTRIVEGIVPSVIPSILLELKSELTDYLNERISILNETLRDCYEKTIDDRLTPIEMKLNQLTNGDLDVTDRTQELPPRKSSEPTQSGIPSVPIESSGDCTNEVELITEDDIDPLPLDRTYESAIDYILKSKAKGMLNKDIAAILNEGKFLSKTGIVPKWDTMVSKEYKKCKKV